MDPLIARVAPDIQWVQDLCGAVRIRAVNLNDTVSANNYYTWQDQNGNFSINSQYLNTKRMDKALLL